jgi:C_GCAxxG_C_C family probable redox protein
LGRGIEGEAEALAKVAVDLFCEGYNCAEAVATAVSRHFGEGESCLPRAATCFGGGMGRQGEVCGALSGALIAVGLRHGRREGDGREAKERAYERGASVVRAFRERFETVLCGELIGVDLNEAEGRERYRRENIRDKYCVDYVRSAAVAAYKAITS